jgi:hypothetical protein
VAPITHAGRGNIVMHRISVFTTIMSVWQIVIVQVDTTVRPVEHVH